MRVKRTHDAFAPTASSLTAIMGSKPGACDGKLVKATANPFCAVLMDRAPTVECRI